MAIHHDNTLSCRYLLEKGANIEHCDWSNDTPLYEAIFFGSHSCLQLLLDWNANYLHKRVGEQTLLHIAAEKGDARMFKALAAADLRGLDANAKDDKWMNARQYFALRSGLPEEFVEAFDALVESLNRVDLRAEKTVEPDTSDDEDFIDAVESLQTRPGEA